MAQAILYDEGVNYPVISAVANGKLEVAEQDVLAYRLRETEIAVVGARASTSDPWEIVIQEDASRVLEFTFGLPAANINPDDLGWKSMADLAIKLHSRPTGSQTWPLLNVQAVGQPGWVQTSGFGIADNTDPSGYKRPSFAELATALWAEMDEAGDATLIYDGTNTAGVRMMTRYVLSDSIAKSIASIMANTTDTAKRISIFGYVDLSFAEASMTHKFDLVQLSGTESIEVGNYALGRREITVETAAPGMSQGYHARLIGAGKAVSLPSIQLDALRKSAKAGTTSRVSVRASTKGDSPALTLRDNLSVMAGYANTKAVIGYACAGDPSGYLEVSFDQANSLNVLATAAFAGLGGLASVGVATELQQLLANSQLSPLFSNIATALGSTTAAVITGYVSALIAAYTQGWISNAQLFNLGNHVSWIQSGYTTILAAAGAGIAIGEIPTLLSYLGVSNNVLSVAMTAVGGAATSAGIALGMAAVMAKCVRHKYWGQ